MALPFVYSSTSGTDTPVVTTAETVIVTLPGVSTPSAGRKVALEGTVQMTLGAGATGLIFRVRRGTTVTDPLVGEANTVQVETAAGSTEDHTVSAVDTPGELVGQTYVVTVQQVAATGNGTVLQASVTATVH